MLIGFALDCGFMQVQHIKDTHTHTHTHTDPGALIPNGTLVPSPQEFIN